MASPKSNSIVFGILMLITQIALAALNGVFIRPSAQNNFEINIGLSP